MGSEANTVSFSTGFVSPISGLHVNYALNRSKDGSRRIQAARVNSPTVSLRRHCGVHCGCFRQVRGGSRKSILALYSGCAYLMHFLIPTQHESAPCESDICLFWGQLRGDEPLGLKE